MDMNVALCWTILLMLEMAAGQKCNDENFYCVSETQMQECADDNPPSGFTFTCPEGLFCSMDCPFPCMPNVPCTKMKAENTITGTPTVTVTDFEIETSTSVLITTQPVIPTTEAVTTTETVIPTNAVPTTEAVTTTGAVIPTNVVTSTEAVTTTEAVIPTNAVTSTEAVTTTTVTVSTPTKPSTNFPLSILKCKAPGKYPDYENCSKYYMCVQNADGSFFRGHLACPKNATYNSVTKRCSLSVNAVCGVAPPTTTPFYPRCKSAGKFADNNNCSLYYVCTRMGDGSGFHELGHQCPGSSRFNAATGRCSMAATITCGKYAAEVPVINDPVNICAKEGKFGDPKNCYNYYTCTRKSNGNYVQIDHTCPSQSRYDTYRKRCSYSILTICA